MDTSQSFGHLTTEELYRRYAGFVAGFLARLSVPAEHLEDALQDVFLVVHRNGGYRPGLAKPTSYLANMAIYAAARHRQRQATAMKRHTPQPVELVRSEAQDPGHELQVRRDMERLRGALDQLPEELRTTLLLVEMEGESCVSVAAALNCPVGTIYSRLHTARKRLQAAIGDDAPRKRAVLNQQALPTRSWMMVFGFGEFRKSEAARLVQLAREQTDIQLPVDELLARLQELQRSGSLPSWASSYAPPAKTLLAVIGAPAALTLTAAAAAVGATLFVRSADAPKPRAPEPSHEPSARVDAAPTRATPDNAADVAPRLEPRPLAAMSPTPERSAVRRSRERTKPAASARGQAASTPARGPSPDVSVPADPVTQSEYNVRAPEPRPTQASARPAPLAPLPTAADPLRANADPALAEIRTIEEVERELASDPQRTLELTRRAQTRFADGNLREERAYLELMALHKLGRTNELRAKAASFLESNPSGVYSARVREVVQSQRR